MTALAGAKRSGSTEYGGLNRVPNRDAGTIILNTLKRCMATACPESAIP